MPAAPQVVTEADGFAASYATKTGELSKPRPVFHLGDAVAGAIAALMGFYSLAFVGNLFFTY